MIDVVLPQLSSATLRCLADTGTLGNRFGIWVARAAELDLTDAPEQQIGLGGRAITARTITTTLQVGDLAWDAPVSFCEPWPFDFQLLGQEGFFRWFRVTFEAAERFLEIAPA